MGHAISCSKKREIPAITKHVALHDDIFETVADHLFEPRPFDYQIDKEPTDICCRKPLWKDVLGFMSASPTLHSIGMARWVVVLKLRTSKDWDTALRYRSLVRELNCLDGCFDTREPKTVLDHFHRLYTLSIDAHSDVQQNPDSGQFIYRTIIIGLPSTVLRLHVKHAHAPDIRIIELVRQCCPSLEELWLGRCTMFNRSPACGFWSAFPFDHDSYIALEGTEDYARSLAHALAPLKQLELLHMGIYLAPSNIVLVHRVFHSRQLVAPQHINWEQAIAIHEGIPAMHDDVVTPMGTPHLIGLLHASLEESFTLDSCSFCRDAFLQDCIHAERQANKVLRGTTSLKSISWMNWFSHSHLGLSREE